MLNGWLSTKLTGPGHPKLNKLRNKAFVYAGLEMVATFNKFSFNKVTTTDCLKDRF